MVLLDLLINLLILLGFFAVLAKSAHVMITNSVKVSEVTGLAKTAVGFILIAFSTSLPELAVALIALVMGGDRIDVSAGNLLGANIVNVCVIIGVSTLLLLLRTSKNINLVSSVAKEELSSLYLGLFIASVIPLSLMYVTYASRYVGFFLIMVFIIYTYQLMRTRIPMNERTVTEEDKKRLNKYITWAFLGIIGVLISAYFIVESAVNIARTIGLPEVLIGGVIIAVGTTLPELAASVRAFTQGHSTIALGNISGSCFVNITLIFGILLLGAPFGVNMATEEGRVFFRLALFSIIANLFLWYFLTNGKIGWKEGGVLLFIYLLFLATTLGVLQPLGEIGS
ncbi:MAG: hypothetical protein QXM22_00510 [Candidatus Bathyarchaeia archaeon]